MLEGFPDRGARAETLVAAFDGELNIFQGEMRGVIASAPRGNNGFGWDSIFIPLGQERTLGEMTAVEKDIVSMRRTAFERFASSVLDHK